MEVIDIVNRFISSNYFLLFLMIMIYTYILVGYSDKIIQTQKQIYDTNLKSTLIITLLTSIIEELTFRYTFWIYDNNMNNYAIISSLIFSLYHVNNLYNSQNIFEIILKYLFQFVAGYHLYLLKSLYWSSFCHIILNFIPILLSWYRYKIILYKNNEKYL